MYSLKSLKWGGWGGVVVICSLKLLKRELYRSVGVRAEGL